MSKWQKHSKNEVVAPKEEEEDNNPRYHEGHCLGHLHHPN
jgi:hypothetical protein